MRYGVISDLHANLHALEECLRFLEDERVDRIVCLGDLVGYGPQPNEVIGRVAELSVPTVMGNHDLVAAGIDPLDRCGSTARTTLAWTQNELSSDSREFLRSLPPRVSLEGGIVAAHGSLDDAWHYVRRVPDALEQLGRLPAEITVLLLGHTHRQMAIDTGSGRVATSDWVIARRTRTMTFGSVCYLNPGAVGQSREPRPVARCAIVDLSERRLHLHALRYPHERCKQELSKRNLPAEWCHIRPIPKKVARQVWRDAQDRRHDRKPSGSDIT